MKIVITVKDTDNVIGLKEDIAMRLEGVADIVRIDTADVVPKSEVEQLKIELEAMRTSANAYKMHYENAKQEVAREIFDEIEKYWIKSDTLPDCARLVDLDKIAELKKKYTGGNNG